MLDTGNEALVLDAETLPMGGSRQCHDPNHGADNMADTDQPPSTESDRLRPHPETRFAQAAQEFDLRELARQLAAEPSAAQRPLRQQALYSRDGATIALFTFPAGGAMSSHTAAGTVTINVIEGRLRIMTPQGQHDLRAGNLLILASGVTHDVQAVEESIMLLQVHLDAPGAPKEK